ncbi:MAG TPA: hypothetical protein DHV48_12855 [Prolixibacteraceae bacterium]|nr:hypothetical protein [Prolixibacteraceae bacterium]
MSVKDYNKTVTALVNTNDPKLNKQAGIDRLEEAGVDFSDGIESTEVLKVPRDKMKNVRAELRYYKIVVKTAPKTQGLFLYDALDYRIKTTRRFIDEDNVIEAGETLTDDSALIFRPYFEGIGLMKKDLLSDAIRAVALENKVHPIREALTRCHKAWDGRPRVDTLTIKYFHLKDNEYTRQTIRKTLVAAVARIFEPGIKWDYVYIIIGPQGCGKSSFIDILGMGYYSDSFSTLQGKEAYEQLIGVWLIEMAELSALKKTKDAETTKHFISKRSDYFRDPYAKSPTDHPRQCVFFATSNTGQVYDDSSGGRRYWPNEVGDDISVSEMATKIHKELPGEVELIWGEAMELYLKGEPLFLSPEIEAIARQTQNEHREIDDRTGVIREFLDTLLPEDWKDKELYEKRNFFCNDPMAPKGSVLRTKVCPLEIWCECYGKTKADFTPYMQRDLHNIMRQMEGWKASKSSLTFGKEYGSQRGYAREQTSARLTKTNSTTSKDISCENGLNGNHAQYKQPTNALN